MGVLTYYILFFSLVTITLLFITLKNKSRKTKLNVAKAIVVFLVISYFPRTLTLDLMAGHYGNNILFGSEINDILILFLRWIYYFSFAVLPIAVFWNNSFFKRTVIFITIPVGLASVVLFKYLLVPLGIEEGIINRTLIFFMIEISLYLILSFYILLLLTPKIKFNIKGLLNHSWITMLMIIYMVPFETIERLFGPSTIEIGMWTPYQKYWFYITIVLIVILYLALKKYSKKTIYIALLYISLGLAFQYMSYYRGRPINFGSVPIQLCNLGSVLTFFAIATKRPKLFYFTYLVNVVGALATFAFPDASGFLFQYYPVHFSYEHTFLLLVPILTVSLGIMPRVKKEELKSALIAFSIYFVIALGYGTIVNAYTEHSPNFFFLFDDYIAEIFKPIHRIRAIDLQIGEMSFWPFYQIGIYFGFIILIWLLLLGYGWAYKTIDEIEYLINVRKERRSDDKMIKNAAPRNINSETILHLKQFKKRYGKSDEFAVKDITLEVKEGEVFGFLGTNGAGKSTTIKSIVGILPITEGDIEICGHSLKKNPLEAKKYIGYVPDNHAVYERLTGREYVNYIADLYQVPSEKRLSAFTRFIKMFNLEHAIDQQIKSYSHGMKQKVAIIAALIHEPKLWILDEPLTGLDPESTYEIKKYMKEHTAKGNTVFFSSHILDVVEKLCDRVAIIKDGNLKGIYDMNDFEKGQDSLEKEFLSVAKSN